MRFPPLFAALLLASASVPRAQVSDGREWAEAGGKFDAAATVATLRPGYTFKHEWVTLRDGVKLATTVFLPPGQGPWATILVRTPYERVGGSKYFKDLTAQKDYICVVQDPRGDGDSQGDPGDPVNSENEIADSYDTIDWVVKQPWCNGRVGMMGGSGNGMCAAMAYLCKHPKLVAVNPANTAGNTALYWAFENGVRRGLYKWLTHRQLKVADWPKPTIYRYDFARWESILAAAAKDNRTVYLGDDGWFNLFGDSALDLFERFAPTGRLFLNVEAKTHGGASNHGLTFKMRPALPPPPTVRFLDLLDGQEPPAQSALTYAVLGDVDDPAAPGNVKRVTRQWPPPNTPTRFYLAPGGLLSANPPTAPGTASYRYDPRDPLPTLGGGWSYMNEPNGAVDQRPLGQRPDLLRFVSEPLAEPLEVAGKLHADLHFSTDVTDTTFVVKFVDIYPDGREILLRESVAMARYRDGFDRPSPLEKGRVYRLAFPCNSAAAAFNRGHRIGVFITSSSHPAFEVHPNTFEPAPSFDASPVAKQTIHFSPDHPSCVILPVTKPAADK